MPVTGFVVKGSVPVTGMGLRGRCVSVSSSTAGPGTPWGAGFSWPRKARALSALRGGASPVGETVLVWLRLGRLVSPPHHHGWGEGWVSPYPSEGAHMVVGSMTRATPPPHHVFRDSQALSHTVPHPVTGGSLRGGLSGIRACSLGYGSLFRVTPLSTWGF